jgi:hypothetical protein
MQAKDGRVAKFMARYDKFYKVIEAYPAAFQSAFYLSCPSTATLS